MTLNELIAIALEQGVDWAGDLEVVVVAYDVLSTTREVIDLQVLNGRVEIQLGDAREERF